MIGVAHIMGHDRYVLLHMAVLALAGRRKERFAADMIPMGLDALATSQIDFAPYQRIFENINLDG